MNYFHFNRHLAGDPSCSRCSMQLHKTTLHVLGDCDTANSFWARLVYAAAFP